MKQPASNVDSGDLNDDSFHVVGIGASAGGLEALERFFKATPADSGMAFVVVQHLSPDFKSLMDELLARHTSMAIVRVEGPTSVRANTIYLMPPRKELVFEQGQLVQVDRPTDQKVNMPISRFFSSLAREMGEKAVAVVLSGTGSDGSRGLLDIHDAGGLVIVQSEESSKFDGMPRSAIATGFANAILAPEEMPAVLARYAADPSLPLVGVAQAEDKSLEFGEVFDRIREAYGIDFSLYKPATITRRIERRLVLANVGTINEYCQAVLDDPAELELLYKDLLIGVTRFFRDPEAFKILREKLIPQVLDAVPEEEDVRVWVPGCATGEEAYSLAILFLQEFERRNRPANLKIFATDVHRNSLRIAAEGLYQLESFEAMAPEIRDRFFNREPDGRYRVLPRLRKSLLVSPHNLIRDVPFNRIDLVSCRNLLIYFKPVAQTKALTAFHFALKLNSILFLGPSETTGELERDFEVLDRPWKIFRKSSENHLPIDLRRSLTGTPVVTRATPVTDFRMSRIYDILLGRFMPPGVLVNDRREIQHLFGDAKRFLHPPEGRTSLDIVAMCDGELRMAVSSAIASSMKRGSRVLIQKVKATAGDREVILSVEADPIVEKTSNLTYVLLQFLEERPVPDGNQTLPQPIQLENEVGDHVQDLEAELKDTRESLQTMVEELETTNEELQASNEELLASNEELQSTNEELHSVNEELYSVNAEHEQKNRDLAATTADLRNLITASQAGIIFTDQRQQVRMFTPGAVKLLNLLPQDIGRPIAHITSCIKDDDIFDVIIQVGQTRQPHEKRVYTADGKCFLRRVSPYEDADKRPSGLVIALVDISELEKTEAKARHLAAIVESSSDAIIGMGAEGVITSWNPAASRVFGYEAGEIVGRPMSTIIPEERMGEAAHLLERLKNEQPIEPMETIRLHKDGHLIDVALTISGIRSNYGPMVGAAVIARDITERKKAEQALRFANQREREIMFALNQHAIVSITDTQGTITFGNDKFCAVSQYSREELVGQNHRIVNSGYHSPEFWQSMWATVGRGETWRGTVCNRAKGGSLYWVEATIVPFLDETGKPRQYLAVRTDITSLKTAEAALRESLRRVEEVTFALNEHAIVAVTDPQGKINFVNEKFCHLSKYSREELLGQDHRLINSGSHPREFIRDLWTTIGNGRVWHGELKNRAKDGSFYWVDTTIVPFLNHEGKPRQYVAVRADITSLKEADEALRLQAGKLAGANRDLELANQQVTSSLQEKEALLREIHHRVKNNMQVISSILKLQAGYIQDPRAQEFFKDCRGRIRTMALIHEELYRSDGLSRIAFKEYLERLTKLLLSSQAHGAAEIECDFQVEAITVDIEIAIPLGLIANELITNCVKHAFAGRQRGKLQVFFQRVGASELRLAVRDDGSGLPPDLNLQNSPSLGLKLIKILTDQLGGSVQWHREPGTEFIILLKEITHTPIKNL